MTVTEEELAILTSETIGGLKVEPVTEQPNLINVLIYGFSGVGKTVLAGSASVVPEMAPVLVCDLEGGTLSLRKTYPQVKVVRITSWVELQKVYDEIILGKTEYRTVVLDSISEFQKLSMGDIMRKAVAKDSDRDFYVPAQREWGVCLGQMREFVRAFRDAPINTIFTALATESQDKRSGLWKTKPSLQGQAGNELPGFVDEVFYYYVKRKDEINTRLLLTGQTDTVMAKDRSGLLPMVMESPTMLDLYNLITGKVDSGLTES